MVKSSFVWFQDRAAGHRECPLSLLHDRNAYSETHSVLFFVKNKNLIFKKKTKTACVFSLVLWKLV